MRKFPLILSGLLATLLCFEKFLHIPTGETIIPLMDPQSRPISCDWRVKAGVACIGGEIYLQYDPETYRLLPNEFGKPIRCVEPLEGSLERMFPDRKNGR